MVWTTVWPWVCKRGVGRVSAGWRERGASCSRLPPSDSDRCGVASAERGSQVCAGARVTHRSDRLLPSDGVGVAPAGAACPGLTRPAGLQGRAVGVPTHRRLSFPGGLGQIRPRRRETVLWQTQETVHTALECWVFSARCLCISLEIRLLMPIRYNSRSNLPAASGMLRRRAGSAPRKGGAGHQGAPTPALCLPGPATPPPGPTAWARQAPLT